MVELINMHSSVIIQSVLLYIRLDSNLRCSQMVGNIDIESSTFHPTSSQDLNQREVVLLSLGVINQPITIDEAYSLTKNLVSRIGFMVQYPLPPFEIYKALVNKLARKGLVKTEYSLKRKKYIIKLTDQGQGSSDYLLDTILNRKTYQIFDEFQGLIDLFI